MSNLVPNRIISRDFVLALTSQVSFGLCYFAYFLLPKFLATQLDAKAAEIGRISSIVGLSLILGMILVGMRIDHYGRRPFVIIGSFLGIVSSLGYLWVDHVGILLYTLRIVQGFAAAFIINATATIVTDITDPKDYGKALGFWGAAFMMSNGIAPYALEPVADAYGWECVFAIATLAGLVSLIASLFIREKRILPHNEHPGQDDTLPVKRLSPVIYSIAVSGAAYGILFTYYQPFALALGIDHIGGFFISFTLAVTISRIFISGSADRFGRRKVATYSLVLYAFSIIAMNWLRAGVLEIIGVAFGFAHGLFYPALTAYAIEGELDILRGRIMTLTNSFFNIGFVIGIWAMGPVIERIGYPIVFMGTGLSVFTAMFALIVKSKR